MIFLAIYILISARKRRNKKRAIWSKKWLLKRTQYTHTNILKELRPYPDDFNNYLRMDEKTYVQLYGILRPLIEKETTQMREPISAHERLTATLRFLATGAKYRELQYMTCISPQALCKIIPETCCAIYQALSKDYLKVSLYIPNFF